MTFPEGFIDAVNSWCDLQEENDAASKIEEIENIYLGISLKVDNKPQMP